MEILIYASHSCSRLGRELIDKETGWMDTYCPLDTWVELRCVIRRSSLCLYRKSSGVKDCVWTLQPGGKACEVHTAFSTCLGYLAVGSKTF